MMDALKHIAKKYNLNLATQSPIEIPNANRETLARIFGELEYKVGAEIGTLRGEYAEVVCKANSGVKLYCIDPYLVYKGHRQHKNQKELTQFSEEARQRLIPYNVEFIREFSVDASKRFQTASLDFVYIDANHRFRHVVDDIDEWYPRVRPGGIIAGHDFYNHKKSRGLHVVQAVTGYTDSYGIHPWFVLGRKNLKKGELRDRFRSWFWVVK